MTTNGDGTTRGIPAGQHGPRDFQLVTPANWYVLDLDPATRSESIAQLVERRFPPGDDPRLVQARRELTALLRGAARDAEENGAVYAALMDVFVDGVALSASLIAVIGDAPMDEDGNRVADPEALAQLLLTTELVDAVQNAAGDSSGDEDPDAPEVISLPAGPAVRLRRITDTGLAGSSGETAKAAETQYFVAVPQTEKVLILTFGTPNVNFRWHFEELFDRIAQTLEWQWESAKATGE